MRDLFEENEQPVISVDAKKKELIGNFHQNGTAWRESPIAVNDHDFPSDALGKIVPYGIYDTVLNDAFVCIGYSHDTACFAVDSIVLWYLRQGRYLYDDLQGVLILADGGGSNASNSRGFKYFLQHNFCNRFNISATVCHYPPGSSKWNPIEHRLFSAISSNFAGTPLTSYEVAQGYIDQTSNESGLTVESVVSEYEYCTGYQISNADFREINIIHHDTLPQWNYSIYPSRR